LGLVLPAETRWWGIIKQNKRVVRLKPALSLALEALLNDDGIEEDKKLNFDFSKHDWQVFIQFAEILAPFKAAIKELEGSLFTSSSLQISGEKYPTLPLVIKHLYSLLELMENRNDLFEQSRGGGIIERVGLLVKHLLAGLRAMVQQTPEEAYIASLLDPRYLDAYIPTAMRPQMWQRLDQLAEEVALPPDEDEAMDLDEAPADHEAPPAPMSGPGTRGRPAAAIPKKVLVVSSCSSTL
jgi:hypothetical protein